MTAESDFEILGLEMLNYSLSNGVLTIENVGNLEYYGVVNVGIGESVEEVSRFLDHSSLAVTSIYLRRLEGQEDRSWGKVAEAIGV